MRSIDTYTKGYYLVDGIYPKWMIFVKIISTHFIEDNSWFSMCQKGCRKNFKPEFGVLQSSFTGRS
jgi:hypothetical protein